MAFPWFYFSQIGNGGVLAVGTEDLGFLHGAGGAQTSAGRGEEGVVLPAAGRFSGREMMNRWEFWDDF